MAATIPDSSRIGGRSPPINRRASSTLPPDQAQGVVEDIAGSREILSLLAASNP